MLPLSFKRHKNMIDNELIKRLLIKQGLFTPDEKKEVKRACKELGLDVYLHSGCPDCWRDAAILIAVKLGIKTETDSTRPTAGGRYICHREGVWYRQGTRVRLTADTDERIIDALKAENERAWANYYTAAETSADTTENTENEADNGIERD